MKRRALMVSVLSAAVLTLTGPASATPALWDLNNGVTVKLAEGNGTSVSFCLFPPCTSAIPNAGALKIDLSGDNRSRILHIVPPVERDCAPNCDSGENDGFRVKQIVGEIASAPRD